MGSGMRLETLCYGAVVLLGSSWVALAEGQLQAPAFDDSWTLSKTLYWGQLKQQATNGSVGTTTSFSSQSISLEKRFSDAFSLGVDLIAHQQNQFQDKAPAGFTQAGRLRRDYFEANVIGRWSYGPLMITPQVRYGRDQFELARPDTTTGLIARAKSDGFHIGGFIEATLTVPLNDYVFVRPVVNFDYEYLTVESFSESGAGPANIAFDKIEDRRAIGEVGMAIGVALPIESFGTLTPVVNVKYRHNFITGPVETHAELASGAADLGTKTLSSGQEKEGILLDAGTILSNNDNLQLWTFYRAQYFPTSTRHGLAAQLKLNF